MKKLVASVSFPQNYHLKHYSFLTNIEDLKEGDKVVVDTVNGLQIVDFVKYSGEDKEFGETFGNKTPKWIIQKVNLEEHNRRLETEKRVKDLKRKMELRRKKAEEVKIYEILAQADPEMAELLNEFKQLKEEI